MDASRETVDNRPAYTDEHVLAYPGDYIAGIDLYNAGEFHAAHDAWEARWVDDCGPREKLFLQAMIQSAVVFHHLEIGRPGAARRMYQMATEKFSRLNTSRFMSLDLVDYQAQLGRSIAWLLTGEDPREITPPAKIEPPVIKLLPGVMDYD
jgi:predicted metal-dependent hydrolase